jgi:serine protease inhibitor
MGRFMPKKSILLLLLQLFFVRISNGEEALSDMETLTRDNNVFAFKMYERLKKGDKNLFFSPYSLSSALAMVYAGARGETEKQMTEALCFTLGQQKLHSSFKALDSQLMGTEEDRQYVVLNIANSLWSQRGYKLQDSFLNEIKTHYGASVNTVDFKGAPLLAVKDINQWAVEKSKGIFKDLISADQIDKTTRLILINAAYFKGNWNDRFEAQLTKDAPFHLSSQKSVQIPMMNQNNDFDCAEFASFQMIELPYQGSDISMFVLLPKEIDGIQNLEAQISTKNLKQWMEKLKEREVILSFPKFKMTFHLELKRYLKAIGMVEAFDDSRANFSGISENRREPLYLQEAIQRAYINVDERGTEAAALTYLTAFGGAAPTQSPPLPVVFKADHPFVYLIQDKKTGAILFMGRIMDPTAKE